MGRISLFWPAVDAPRWVEVEYRLDGVLKIRQLSGLTNHEVLTKANEFIEGLM